MHFKATAGAKLKDAQLQRALKNFQGKFVQGRADSIRELDNFEDIREAAAQIRDRVLNNIECYLDEFEREATARGAVVHWAETAAEASRILCAIAARNGVRKVVKSKSMVSEECGVNEALEAAGVQVVETDLGEYILQLAREPPSHIIAPIVHKNKEEVSDLFEKIHRRPRKTSISELCREAREMLRNHFLSADMGISGGNFLIAETGSVLLVTNEGNGRMCTTLPRVHAAIVGIEKIVPTLEDAATLMRLLPRSAAGQAISNYVSLLTGPQADADLDGPREMHFILVDNGRSRLLGTDLQAALRCIRCGACMNHCPVYQNIGGHPYGWVYPGPIGSILTPLYAGLEHTIDLPNASTFCNQCGVVCPVKIPLPDLQRKLREMQVKRGLRPRTERMALRLWSWLALRPRLYGFAWSLAARVLSGLGGKEKLIHRLPFGSEWTNGRDMPAPEGQTFRALYARKTCRPGCVAT